MELPKVYDNIYFDGNTNNLLLTLFTLTQFQISWPIRRVFSFSDDDGGSLYTHIVEYYLQDRIYSNFSVDPEQDLELSSKPPHKSNEIRVRMGAVDTIGGPNPIAFK